ncbi:MAG: glycoside hydrolase family 65 protein [Saprospiraceae bacterium]|nr:glycoside hydrolase family 65 protein [Bacteroidia bacterium]NNE13935.1 glycoside hydrolase family 65 protein [Saprospiraceae bacterium]NNL91621.1 glycoside hydrolase family 65 protein [Saprospiraceae bacterium]
MKNYLEQHPWKVIENGYHPEHNKITESIFSLGNGYMGHRANFEEGFGDTMQGSYLAGIYYPDKTKVGWWKNGYPEYFAKVLNAVNWIGIDLFINDERLTIKPDHISDFTRILDMGKSILSRKMTVTTDKEEVFIIESERFCSWNRKEIGALKYKVSAVNFSGKLTIKSNLDFDVYNQDSNYDEQFWESRDSGQKEDFIYVQSYTKKTLFEVQAMASTMVKVGTVLNKQIAIKDKVVSHVFDFNLTDGQSIEIEKIVSIASSFNHNKETLLKVNQNNLEDILAGGYAQLKSEHVNAWADKWSQSDIVINGDVAAQQGIRFNIFHLHQTYSGDDARLNIGPKGFTGEKYGGSTYWDTEAYCLPFFLSNADAEVSRNLLMYRHNHLDKAIENAEKLGFKDGAALYPMVTMNGEECHNEWEITFEEIHRNGAIAYAIFDYTRYTDSDEYLNNYGIDVLVAISRFWAQRVNWSKDKEAYVMLGITGPNEYENNVNNNWYTNYMAAWCLRYTKECLDSLSETNPQLHEKKVAGLKLSSDEFDQWKKIIDHMYYPYDMSNQLILQQDGFMDKELIPVAELDESIQPLHQHWSWDRILRSCYIKQADVLQGMYFFEDDFDNHTLERHFRFYEPLTVHESSLSPCIHAILASKLGMKEKAYEMYLRTARLDLDDYNNDTEDGLHITSMAGTWMAIVKGFGGMRIENKALSFNPFIPEQWESYSFKLSFRGQRISVKVTKENMEIENLDQGSLHLNIRGKEVVLNGEPLKFAYNE